MTTTTLRPNATPSTVGPPTLVGASYHAAASDDSDSTYAQFLDSGSQYQVTYDFGTFTIPAGAVVRSVTPRLRHDNGEAPTSVRWMGVQSLQSNGVDYGQFSNDMVTNNGGVAAVQTGTALTTNVYGASWDQASIDSLRLNVGFILTDTYRTPFKVFEAYIDVVYNSAPTATATGPNSTVSTAKPTITWTYADADGDIQERYRIKVFTAAQYGAAGFDPNTSTPTVDSGETFSSATSWTCPTPLANGVSYRAFIFVADAGSGGRYNTVTTSGPYATCTVSLTPPAVPTITAITTQTSDMSYILDVQDRQNHLGTDNATFESSLSSWVAETNCVVARSTAQKEDGTASMSLTASSASSMSAITGMQQNIAGNATYSWRAAFFTTAAVARSITVSVLWYDSGNTLISTSTAAHTGAQNVWVPVFWTANSPSNATQCKVRVGVITPANAEVHYVDNVTLVPLALNMLNDPMFEVDSNADGVADDWTNYTAGTGTCTASMDASKVYAGNYSQKLVIDPGASSGYGGISQSVRFASTNYKAQVVVWSSANCTIDIYTPTSGSHTVAVTAGAWTTISATIAPGAAVNESIYIRTQNAVTLWIGAVQLEVGTLASALCLNRKNWLRGGAITNWWEFQRSYDGGVTWSDFTRLALNGNLFTPLTDTQTWRTTKQQITGLGDYEATRSVTPTYRVRAAIDVDSTRIVSAWSIWQAPYGGNLPLTGWWFKSIYHPSYNQRVYVNSESLTWASDTGDGVFWPIGRRGAVVISDVIHGEQLDIELSMLSEAAHTALEALRGLQETLLVQSPYGDQYYMRAVTKRSSTHVLNHNGPRTRANKLTLVEVTAP